MADQRCKAVINGKICGEDAWHWSHSTEHDFEPEDAAPAPMPVISEDERENNLARLGLRTRAEREADEAGVRVAGFVQGPIEGNPSCHVCGDEMCRWLDADQKQKGWACFNCGTTTGCEPVWQRQESCPECDGDGCNFCEPVAQTGAGGDKFDPPCNCAIRQSRLKQGVIGSHHAPSCPQWGGPRPENEPQRMARRLSPAEPILATTGHLLRSEEQRTQERAIAEWPEPRTMVPNAMNQTLKKMDESYCLGFNDALEACKKAAAHVTKGLEAELRTAKAWADKNEFLLDAQEKTIKVLSARNLELMGELERIAKAVAQMPTVTGLQEGCLKDHSLIHMAILDAQATFKDTVKRAEKRLAEAEKALETCGKLSELINAYRAKRKYDGGGAFQRDWDAAEHFKWDTEVERLELALSIWEQNPVSRAALRPSGEKEGK